MSESKPTHLVFPRYVWERIVPRLLTGSGLCAFGPLTRNEHPAALELLVHDLQIRDTIPDAGQLQPLTDWLLLATAAGEKPKEVIKQWIEQFGPRASQLLTVALVGLGEGRQGWAGTVACGERREPLAGLQIVGPGMIRTDLGGDQDDDEQPSTTRYSRLDGAIRGPNLAKVRRSHVALFGASRTGSAAAFLFAALGVRKITLIDFDVLEPHHLDCNRGVSEYDIGLPKVKALAKRLLEFRSDLAVTVLACRATDAPVVDAVRGADLLVTCVDSDTPRLVAAVLGQRFLKVHLDIGTGVTATENNGRQLASDVRLLLPGQGCVCCVGGLADEESARYELLAPPGALQRGQPVQWNEQRLGSLITLNEMTVSIGVQLWLDLLAGELRTSHWHRLRWQPGGGVQADYASVDADSGCTICRPGAGTAA